MTVSKIRWLGRSEPENAARTHTVVLPHDWLSWQIGGRSFEVSTDRGDASGTCYFDAASDAYRDDLVRLAIGHELALPRVAGPKEIVGHSPDGIAIAAGTGDNMAAGLGLGLRAGEAVVSLGTSGTAFTLSDQQTHDPTGTVAGFADATGNFLPLVCTLNGARNSVVTAELLGVSLAELSRLALSAPPGSEGVVFLPYLEGERTPPLPDAQGQLVGLTLSNFTPANVARAAIEGVLWSLAYGLQVLREQTGDIGRVDPHGRRLPVRSGSDHRVGRLRTSDSGHRRVRERRGGCGSPGRLGPDRRNAGLADPGPERPRPDRSGSAGRDPDRRAIPRDSPPTSAASVA